MKKLAALAVAALLAACGETPTQPVDQAAPADVPPVAMEEGAVTSTRMWEEPWESELYVPCTGENVLISGTMRFTERWVLLPDGRHIERWSMSMKNLRGVGLTSGDTYLALGRSSQYVIELTPDAGARDVHGGMMNQRLVKPGPDQIAYVFRLIVHVTQGPDGEPFAMVMLGWESCG